MKFQGEIFLSELYKKYLMAPDGSRVGKISDFSVSQGDVFPLIDSFVIAGAGGRFKLAYEEIEVLNRRFVLCRQPADKLPRQALAAKDILAVKDIWDKQIVDINGAKIVRVNDIKVREIDGKLCLIAVDVGIRGLMRRLGLKHNDWRVWKKMVQHIPYDLISWRYLQPLEDDITHLTLTVSNREMQSLHPYEIADLLTQIPPDNQESLINSLGIDKVAEAIPEMDERHQKDLLERMDEGKAADIMDAMSPDDAADILGDLPEEQGRGHHRRDGGRGGRGREGAPAAPGGHGRRPDDHRLSGRRARPDRGRDPGASSARPAPRSRTSTSSTSRTSRSGCWATCRSTSCSAGRRKPAFPRS